METDSGLDFDTCVQSFLGKKLKIKNGFILVKAFVCEHQGLRSGKFLPLEIHSWRDKANQQQTSAHILPPTTWPRFHGSAFRQRFLTGFIVTPFTASHCVASPPAFPHICSQPAHEHLMVVCNHLCIGRSTVFLHPRRGASYPCDPL